MIRKKQFDEAKDHDYVETDPSGRYGRFEEMLGKGAMKTVYKAIDEVLGMEVAWGAPIARGFAEAEYCSFFTLSTPTSPTQVNKPLIDDEIAVNQICRYRKKYKRVDIRAIKNWARQILQGLVYLHAHDPPVIHRYLKCDNIFVNGHLGQVKIGDLGLAAILRGSKSAHSVIGTPEFMAPELYEEDYNQLVDVYSFGMCVLEMLTSEYPYSECANPAQIYKKVTSGKLPGAFYQVQDLDAQRFIGKCLVTASNRLSAEQLLLDPFLAKDEATRLGSPKLFLNQSEIEKLHLNDNPPRTDMTITGKLNPEDDTIFLKVQIADTEGSTRNIYFPFDIVEDTPLDVATEMVKELEITDWDPLEIAEMIDGEISALVPQWKKSDLPRHQAHNTYNYQEDDDEVSSSVLLFLLLFFIPNVCLDVTWLRLASSSQSSSHSGIYSNFSYLSGDDHNPDMSPTTTARKHVSSRIHNSTRFWHGESSRSGLSIGSNKGLESHVACSSKHTRLLMGNRKLTRNRSLVDIRSQLLHRSLVEEDCLNLMNHASTQLTVKITISMHAA
ncbi:hypothetical protein J1N35_046042 [Gossypium stocksii]|uniref:non-specific serine/threonine protein kinase n=1 Tax=Gossypium stocksii TaxID=47602 RepID=A0A9D3U5A1_9ROSI|nr:hypothetical protein J1N35_046042 [Gossypium stocksii]